MKDINTKEGRAEFMERMYKLFKCKDATERGILLMAMETFVGKNSIDLVNRYNHLKEEHYETMRNEHEQTYIEL